MNESFFATDFRGFTRIKPSQGFRRGARTNIVGKRPSGLDNAPAWENDRADSTTLQPRSGDIYQPRT
jgi:hypothetical protein